MASGDMASGLGASRRLMAGLDGDGPASRYRIVAAHGLRAYLDAICWVGRRWRTYLLSPRPTEMVSGLMFCGRRFQKMALRSLEHRLWCHALGPRTRISILVG